MFGKSIDGFLAGVLASCTDRHCARASLGDACGRGTGGQTEQRANLSARSIVVAWGDFSWPSVTKQKSIYGDTANNIGFVFSTRLRVQHVVGSVLFFFGHTAGYSNEPCIYMYMHDTMPYQAEMTRPIPCVPPVTRKFFPVPASTTTGVRPRNESARGVDYSSQ